MNTYFPNEELYEKSIVDSGDPLHIPDLIDELNRKAREEESLESFFTR
jgi:hypothetical protein